MYDGKQVLRLETKYKAKDLYNIGIEMNERKGTGNYDKERSKFNVNYVSLNERNLYQEVKQTLKNRNIDYLNKPSTNLLNGVTFTSGNEFFESLGMKFVNSDRVYKTGNKKGQIIKTPVINSNKDIPQAVTYFFDSCMDFLKEQVGEENILLAQIHYDEDTPHLQAYFLPIVNEVNRKCYVRDDKGNVVKEEVKNKSGNTTIVPKLLRDEKGKIVYEKVKGKFLNNDQFWKDRGGKNSYAKMQDSFNKFINARGFKLDRGNIGSNKEHLTKLEFQIEENKAEAINAERVFFLELDKYRPDNDMTFKDLYTAFYEYQKDKVKETTLNTYKDRMRYMALLDNVKVKGYNIQNYELWRKKMLEYNLSNRTRNYVYKFLKTIMNFGTKWYGLNFSNIYPKMTNFTDPNEIKKEMEFWTYEEFKQFISVEKDLVFKSFFKTLYFCGLRKGEIRALTWNDINFDNSSLTVNKGLSDNVNGKKYIITSPKTLSSNRTLPMPKELVNDLLELKEYYKQFSNYSEEWFVFGGPLPLGDDKIRRRKNENCKLANVKQIRIHDFRHSCASLLINNGADITLVAKFLGHSKIEETLNTYSHMFKNKLNNIVSIIDNLNSNSQIENDSIDTNEDYNTDKDNDELSL